MEEAKTLTPQSKLTWLREFEQNKFWNKVFKPWLTDNQKTRLFNLLNCKVEDVEKVRAAITVLQAVEEYPESLKKMLQDEIELEKSAKRQKDSS